MVKWKFKNGKELAFKKGVLESMVEGTESEWLLNYFEKNKESLSFFGCETLCTTKDVEPTYYTLEINGNDQLAMSFIIQDENLNDLERIDVKEDFSNVKECFYKGLEILIELVSKLS